MTPEFTEEELRLRTKLAEFAEEVADKLISRRRTYGSANVLVMGIPGVAVRLSDKASRIWQLSVHDQADDEPLHDALVDTAGYAFIGMMLEAGESW